MEPGAYVIDENGDLQPDMNDPAMADRCKPKTDKAKPAKGKQTTEE